MHSAIVCWIIIRLTVVYEYIIFDACFVFRQTNSILPFVQLIFISKSHSRPKRISIQRNHSTGYVF